MRFRMPRAWLGLVLAGFLACNALPANAASVMKRNLVDLIDLSDQIMVGNVVHVTDGFQNGVPFTQITLQVKESYLQDVGETFTFRQFGLTEPRPVGDKMYLGVSPDGWPSFAQGEQVMVFLCEPGSMTGFCTTIGLFQGKFVIENGQIANEIANRGLFDDVRFDGGLLSPSQEKCVLNTEGAIPAADMISIVRTAVQDSWIDQGRMSRAN